MATLESLKLALKQKAMLTGSSLKRPLSDAQYSAGFDILVRGSGWATYQNFIIPQLSQLLACVFNSRSHISALEIGPGPKSLLGYLPSHLRQQVKRYTAFEPNDLFATRLKEWLETDLPFPCLKTPPYIHRVPFVPHDSTGSNPSTCVSDDNEKYDIILFCHSMYGLKPKDMFVKQALDMLGPQDGIVAIFHRDVALHLEGLVCHHTAFYPTGVIRVADDDEVLDCFASFIAGFVLQGADANKAMRVGWREVCRAFGHREDSYPGQLSFSSPEVMVALTKHATALPDLMAEVPFETGSRLVKNRLARLNRTALLVKPTEIRHVQQCVRWALKHRCGLTIVGGSHSGHCLWPNVVSVDMSAFGRAHICTVGEDGADSGVGPGSFVVAETGCTTGDIVRTAMGASMTVPLGARPSVGAGLWLQGGMGHLARLYGLTCDAIVGAVVVSVESSQVLCVGDVPSQYQPADAVRPENESDLLWAIKGAGTNFGIVISVTFKGYAAPTYLTRNWNIPLSDHVKARLKLSDFDELVASKLYRNCSADAYLYWDVDQLHLGVTLYESISAELTLATPTPTLTAIRAVLGPENDSKVVDGVGLFEIEMYVSGMHGGHSGGKTSSFKRCLFLKHIGEANVADHLVTAVETRPSPLCYLHLLQGGGAVTDVASDATAFGCRNWAFACVITGVWLRDQDGTDVARSAIRWVYEVCGSLLSMSCGAYSADLGPDPRDAALAAKAFGSNGPRLAHLKRSLDPYNVLPYACPFSKASKPKLIILVTGGICTGKDYCADIWVSVFAHENVTARTVSISDATKREYAAATGADLNYLLQNRAYKEQHRPALTRFFREQVQRHPRLLEEHFLDVVYGAVDVDVLLITGMRDEAPVATLSHLVPESRLLEVQVETSKETQRVRQGCHHRDADGDGDDNKDSHNSKLDSPTSDHRPSLIFDNERTGAEMAKSFAKDCLLPFLHEDMLRLANMVRLIPNFPHCGIDFRHVLGISQQPGGLVLCTSLLRSHFTGDWAKVDAVVCCEAGGFVFASALVTQVDVPLVLIREGGKLPPPTVSVTKPSSHISSLAPNTSHEKVIEMERDVIPRGASVVVVDDVFSTGETLCAVLRLLGEAGIGAKHVSIMAVVEFPAHRGRELLRRRGFGGVNVQSLLVFGGD